MYLLKNKMNIRRILIFFLVILLLSIFSILYPTLTGNTVKQDYYPKEQATLLRAVDGDTKDPPETVTKPFPEGVVPAIGL